MLNSEPIFSVSDFVAVLNQTLEFAYPTVTIEGELSNFRVSKNKWVYFDLKDEYSSVKFFGTIYQLSGPLEDGLTIQVKGTPRLHPLYGFSVTVMSLRPVGEGSIKKAASLLEAKLKLEGLFDVSRKRALPYPPQSIGLITSSESAAYQDFIKIINQRWGGINISLIDVQVQGEAAASQIIQAINYFNQSAEPPEVLVVTRGGGSVDDLAVFSGEQLTRAIAGSRIPTIVAIGHEVDISLAELAADRRASTPSNAAELLTPDKKDAKIQINQALNQLKVAIKNILLTKADNLNQQAIEFEKNIHQVLVLARKQLSNDGDMLLALSPQAVLKRGYAIVRNQAGVIRSSQQVTKSSKLTIEVSDAYFDVSTESIRVK